MLSDNTNDFGVPSIKGVSMVDVIHQIGVSARQIEKLSEIA